MHHLAAAQRAFGQDALNSAPSSRSSTSFRARCTQHFGVSIGPCSSSIWANSSWSLKITITPYSWATGLEPLRATLNLSLRYLSLHIPYSSSFRADSPGHLRPPSLLTLDYRDKGIKSMLNLYVGVIISPIQRISGQMTLRATLSLSLNHLVKKPLKRVRFNIHQQCKTTMSQPN